jgi:hypothetical protein
MENRKEPTSNNIILYVDPNKELPLENQGKDRGMIFNPEDYCISVNLRVGVPNKNGKAGTQYFKIEWTTDTRSGNVYDKVSFFTGRKVGNDNFLTDYYEDISYEQSKSGDVKEALGIKSIDIGYNSWYLPEITIQFVDIRGLSLMNPSEASYKNDDSLGSFFKAFFTIPYPLFRLQIKGYYGDPVTYDLCPYDFRTTLDAESGNVLITGKFVGYTFEMLADIPFEMLKAAPYINNYGYDCAKYWETNTAEPNGTFKFDNGEPLITISELMMRVRAANTILNDFNTNSEDLKDLELHDTLKPLFDKIGTYYKESNFGLFHIIEAKCKTYGDEFIACQHGNNGITASFKWRELLALVKCNELNREIEDIISKLNEDINVFNQNSNGRTLMNFSAEFKESVVRENGREVDSGIPITMDNNTPHKSDESYTIYLDYTEFNDQYEALKNSIFKKGVVEAKKNVIAQLNEELSGVLGFEPYIGNIVKIVFAHFETFFYGFFKCVNSITGGGNSRKLKDYIVDGTLVDIESEGNFQKSSQGLSNADLPPFFGMHTSKGNGWEDVYPKNTKIKKNIVYPSREFEEINFIRALNESIINYRNSEEYFNSGLSTNDSNGWWFPVNPFDIPFKVTFSSWDDSYHHYQNPYIDLIKNNNCEYSDLLFNIGVRMYLGLSTWGSGEKGVEVLATAEALNVYAAIHDQKDYKTKLAQLCEKNEEIGVDEVIKGVANKKDNKLNLMLTVYPTGGYFRAIPIYSRLKSQYTQKALSSLVEPFYQVSRRYIFFIEYDGRYKRFIDHLKDTQGNLVVNWDIDIADEFFNIITLRPWSANITSAERKIFKDQNVFDDKKEEYQSIRGLFPHWEESGSYYPGNYGMGGSNTSMIPNSSQLPDNSPLNNIKLLRNDNTSIYHPALLMVIGNKQQYDVFGSELAYKYNYHYMEYMFLMGLGISAEAVIKFLGGNSTLVKRIPKSIILVLGAALKHKAGWKEEPLIIKNYYKKIYTSVFGDEAENWVITDLIEQQIKDYYDTWLKTFNEITLNIKDGQPGVVVARGLCTDTAQQPPDNFISNLITEIQTGETEGGMYNKMVEKCGSFFTKNFVGGLVSDILVSRVKSKKFSLQIGLFLKPDGDICRMIEDIYRSDVILFKSYATDSITLAHAKEYFDTFANKLNELMGNDNADENTQENLSRATSDMAIKSEQFEEPKYFALKKLYDRWISGNTMKKDDFMLRAYYQDGNVPGNSYQTSTIKIIDKYYNDISNAFLCNLETLNRVLNDMHNNNGSLLTFLARLFSSHKMMFIPTPHSIDLKRKDKLLDIFKPKSYNEMNLNIIQYPGYTAVYTGDTASDRGLNILNFKESGNQIPGNADNPNIVRSYTMPVFVVSYGKQAQSYFKIASLSNTNPTVTEQSIRAQYDIAASSAGNNTLNSFNSGQDLYDVYSKNSYQAEIEMLGCAQIQPLMYFQLSNVYLFSGAYMIFRMSHQITPGKMITRFTGIRQNMSRPPMSKYSFMIQSALNSLGGGVNSSVSAVALDYIVEYDGNWDIINDQRPKYGIIEGNYIKVGEIKKYMLNDKIIDKDEYHYTWRDVIYNGKSGFTGNVNRVTNKDNTIKELDVVLQSVLDNMPEGVAANIQTFIPDVHAVMKKWKELKRGKELQINSFWRHFSHRNFKTNSWHSSGLAVDLGVVNGTDEDYIKIIEFIVGTKVTGTRYNYRLSDVGAEKIIFNNSNNNNLEVLFENYRWLHFSRNSAGRDRVELNYRA